MSASIWIGCEQGIKFSNSFMAALHDKLEELVIRNGLGSNALFVKIVFDLDQSYHGSGNVGFDVQLYFEDKPIELSIFIGFIGLAASELNKEDRFDESAVNSLLRFNEKLIDYWINKFASKAN